MNNLSVGVVGVGHLGQHHARILRGLDGVELVGVADSHAKRCAEIAAQCGVPAFENYRELIRLVDAASIVVPTSLHFEVAAAFLGAGKSVLVEKPLAADVGQAETLVELAHRHGATLQVGHIERFNPVLGAVPQLAEPPRLIEARRVGPYSFRSTDISVIFDLMIHDLDIVLTIVGEAPERVTASGWSVFGGHDDVVHARIEFRCGTEAHLTASRADVRPSREMTIRWTSSVAHLDFATRRSVVAVPTAKFHHAGDLFVNPPPLEFASLRDRLHKDFFHVTELDGAASPELLAVELDHFISCVRTGREPLVNGRSALAAVRLADAIARAAHPQPHVGLAKAA